MVAHRQPDEIGRAEQQVAAAHDAAPRAPVDVPVGAAPVMLALSFKQPWLWAIVEGIKPVENRSWRHC